MIEHVAIDDGTEKHPSVTEVPTPSERRSSEDATLLIVDGDAADLRSLSSAMAERGFAIRTATCVTDGLNAVDDAAPACALIELRLEDGNGLDLVKHLNRRRHDARIVVLTGYGGIPTAVAAVKAGASDYLPKPADFDDIESTLRTPGRQKPPPPENAKSIHSIRWEHIQRIHEECDFNVSRTARRLNMHRRTLQRIFAKHA